jgi:hypothetical protein
MVAVHRNEIPLQSMRYSNLARNVNEFEVLYDYTFEPRDGNPEQNQRDRVGKSDVFLPYSYTRKPQVRKKLRPILTIALHLYRLPEDYTSDLS